MKKMDRKGQVVEQLGGMAVGIAVLAISLTIAFLVMSEGKDQAEALISTTSITNETITFTNNTPTNLALDCVSGTISCTQVHNNSVLLGTGGNFSCTDRYIQVWDNDTDKLNGWDVSLNVTYSCKIADQAVNGTEELQNATNDIPGWVPLIVIAVIGSILLGLVALFRRRG